MNKKIIKQFLVVTGLMILGLVLVNAIGVPGVLAQTSLIREGDDPGLGGGTNLRELVLKIVNFFLGFLGLLAVIMVIYGGFLYVSSAGNQEKVDSAKKILLYAVIGIVVILVSFALVNTLLGGLTRGTDVPGGGV